MAVRKAGSLERLGLWADVTDEPPMTDRRHTFLPQRVETCWMRSYGQTWRRGPIIVSGLTMSRTGRVTKHEVTIRLYETGQMTPAWLREFLAANEPRESPSD